VGRMSVEDFGSLFSGLYLRLSLSPHSTRYFLRPEGSGQGLRDFSRRETGWTVVAGCWLHTGR